MAPNVSLFASLALVATSYAAAIERQPAASCSSYTLIDTRGTTEPQGPSAGFRTMNKNILAAVPGGKEYDVVYPAGIDQNSSAGTKDIVDHIHSTLAANPDECFILEGYSQGASAVCDALPQLAGKAFNAVKGVFLIGNPEHQPGLACNVDIKGGDTTRNARGILSIKPGIPADWISKSLDVLT